MTQSDKFDLIVVGDRINPGFKSVRTLVDNNDIPGIQALAIKQVEAARAISTSPSDRARSTTPRS